MKQYQLLGNDILNNGNQRGDRTGTGTISVFGRQVRYDLTGNVVPLLTTKKMFLRGLLEELFWLNAGDTDNTTLANKNVGIWAEWAVKSENLEYSMQERAGLALKQISGENLDESMEEDLRAVLDNKDAPQDVQQRVLEIFQGYEIQELKPNPLGVKVGALGPIYGEQWRRWPTQSLIAFPLSLRERVEAARELDKKFNFAIYNPRAAALTTIWDRLEKGDIEDEMAEDYHKQLDNYNVPAARHEFATIDQMTKMIEDLKVRPTSRRIIVSAWNPSDMPDETVSPEQNVMNGKAALASCHTLFQFYVEERNWNDVVDDVESKDLWGEYLIFRTELLAKLEVEGNVMVKTYRRREWSDEPKGYHTAARKWCLEHGIPVDKLSCQLYQRSADFALGVPFNVASYSILTMMVAQCVGMVAGEFIHTFGDLHIYLNHIEKMEEQLTREPFALPTIKINPAVKNIFDFKIEDFELVGYDSHPKIDYPIAK